VAKKYPYSRTDPEIFKDVVFLVEATFNEQHHFWVDYHHEPKRGKSVPWEQISRGHMVQIGEIDGRPVNVSIFYSMINGKKVMFYEGCSQVVDYKMIDDWLQHFTLNTIRWDNGNRWAHCDSSNFHHCLDAVDALHYVRGE
jgi:hypothetical protein